MARRLVEITRVFTGQWVVTRAVLSNAPLDRLDDPERVLFRALDTVDDPTGRVYDPITDTLGDPWTPPVVPDPPAPAPSTLRSRLAFRSRFTEAEQVALEVAMLEHPNVQVRAMLRVFDKNLSDATEIRLDDPRTQLGLTRLVAAGLLTAQRRSEILDPTWEPTP